MRRLTRDGTTEPVSRDQILRHERGQGNIQSLCLADHVQDWQRYPVDPYSCYMCDHTYMMFAVRRLQELGRKVRVPLFLCFIDLQKAYDSVDRKPLWQVLPRFGVPQQMIEVIRQLHDGMRERVRSDDGRCSGWFEVAQGLR